VRRNWPDKRNVKRIAVLVACLGVLVVPSAALAAKGNGSVQIPASWAQEEIEQVVGAGLLATDVASFRPDDPVTHGELYDAIEQLGLRAQKPAVRSRPVTMRELDARLVGALGLTASARRIRLAARDAGLKPPAWLGTETIARLIGLRLNHPFGQDQLERGIADPAPRAEVAYSLSRLLSSDSASLEWVDQLSSSFVLPQLTDWQRTVLTRAVQFVGLPYIWTGTSERPQQQWASDGITPLTVPGGFDCSGFAWRIYKVKAFPGAPETLASAIRGRTTFDISGEMPRKQRVAIRDLQPGDLVFFGARGPRSKPNQVDHMGIYVGSGWFVHSSRAGVTLQPLQGWYATSFAWGRRPLAEAGLTA
jgi:cell wall-associated NlpC family hydrolase